MTYFVPNMGTGPCLYCGGMSPDAPEEMLRCELCRGSAHITCLRNTQPEGRLLGDNLFEYTCSNCHQGGQDVCVRGRLSMPQILLLVLYNMHKSETYSARAGFYHWKLHIYNFINQNWKNIFGPESRKKKKKVVQASLSGQLAHYSHYFVSGYETLRDGGWYRLAVVLPPTQLIQRYMEEKRGGRSSTSGDSNKINKHTASKEDFLKVPSFETPVVKEEPAERESISSGDVSFDSLSHDESSRGSWFTERDLLKPNNCPPQLLFDSDDEENTSVQVDVKEEIPIKEEISVKEEMIDIEEFDTGIDMKTEIKKEPLDYQVLKPSLFTKAPEPPSTPPAFHIQETLEELKALTKYEEHQLLSKLEHFHKIKPLPMHLHRLRRKLIVRKSKYEHGLPLFDLDAEISHIKTYGRIRTHHERISSRKNFTDDNASSRVLDRFQVAIGDDFYKYVKSSNFLVKLLGDPEGAPLLIHSPYTLRKLKPFIWRDFESVPLKYQVLQEILRYPHRHDPSWVPPPRQPIDYCYVTPKHIPAMNHLAQQFFWPGIDLSEVLQYPDHTCVVLYRNLVIGFGVLVPDVGFNMAYLSFLLVHPEWRRAGIATFILYHLIQTCMGKDVTLHVSATNPALMLYQKFGFKVEEFLSNFYDKYLSEDSHECKHAMYLRLSR